jgi:hypothetical protein
MGQDTNENDEFSRLAARVEALLLEANEFIEAAKLLDKAANTNRDERNSSTADASFFCSQGQQAVQDALELLSNPEFMADPKKALQRAELIYLGARVSSGLHTTDYSRRFFSLLPAISSDIGRGLSTKIELDDTCARLIRDKAKRELAELVSQLRKEKIAGRNTVLIFERSQGNRYKNASARVQSYIRERVVVPKSTLLNRLFQRLSSKKPVDPYDAYHGVIRLPLAEFPLNELREEQRLIVHELIALGYEVTYEVHVNPLWMMGFRSIEERLCLVG